MLQRTTAKLFGKFYLSLIQTNPFFHKFVQDGRLRELKYFTAFLEDPHITKIEFLEPITGSSRKKEDNSFIGSQNFTRQQDNCRAS